MSQSIVHQEKNDLGEVDLKENFPHFLWLLRDCRLKNVDRQGVPITPSENLRSKILIPSGKPNPTSGDLVTRVINSCFPSVECRQIPPPASDPNEDKDLGEDFNKALEQSISFLLAHINPKIGGNGKSMSGDILAKLALMYTEALNCPDQQLDIDKSWINAVKQQLSKISDTLIKIYESEMNKLLESKLPIEEGSMSQLMVNIGEFKPSNLLEEPTLYDIHLNVFSAKYQQLKEKVHFYIPNDPQEDESDILSSFHQRVVQIKDENIEGGLLQTFIHKNRIKSLDACNEIFQRIHNNSQQSIVLADIEERYLQLAIGPAKFKVLKQKLAEIPGSPFNLRFTDVSTDRVTLSWDKPHINAKVITSYDVEQSCDGQIWVRAESGVHHTLVQVLKLTPNSKYWFRVCGYNERIKGETSHSILVTTKAGKPSKPSKPSVKVLSCTEAMIEVQRLKEVEENGSPVTSSMIESKCSESDSWTSVRFQNTDHYCTDSECYEFKINIDVHRQSYSRNVVLVYRVRMINSVGESEPSDIARLRITELLPGPPESLKLDATGREINASWKPPSINPTSLDYYKIEMKKDNQCWKMVHSSYKDVKNKLKDLEPVSTYKIKITSCNSVFPNGKEECTTITGKVNTTADKPQQPKEPKVVIAEGYCNRAFLIITRLNKEEENGSTVHSIDIERSILNKQRKEVGAREMQRVKIKDEQQRDGFKLEIPVNIGNTNQNTAAVQYRIFMVNEIGQSKPCDTVELPVTELIPGHPRNTQATNVQSRQVSISWQCPSVNPASALFYSIELKEGDESWRMLHQKITEFNYDFKNLSPATEYEIRITSCNVKHCHVKEDLSTVVFPIKTSADSPNRAQISRVNIDEKFHNIALVSIPRLLKEEENGEPVTEVVIEHVGVNKQGKNIGCPRECTFQVQPGDYGRLQTFDVEHNAAMGVTDIHFRAVMVNAIGKSVPSEVATLSMAEFIPGPIRNLEVTLLMSKQVSVSWEVPNVNQASVTFYSVEIKQNSQSIACHKVNSENYMCSFRELKPATKYEIFISSCNDKYSRGYNQMNLVSKSICTKADVPNKPAEPIVEIDPKHRYNKVHVSVPRLQEEEQNGSPVKKIIISHIGVTKSGNQIGAWREKEFDVVNDNRCNFGFEVELLVNLTREVANLYFKVVMENTIGKSESSGICTIDTFTLIPGPPQDLTPSHNDLTYNSITVVWKQPQHNPRCVDYYHLQMKGKHDTEWVDVSKHIETANEHNRVVVPNLTPNSSYDIRLYAVNKDNTKCPTCVTLESVETRKCRPPKVDAMKVTLVIKSSKRAFVTFPKPNIQDSGSEINEVVIERYNERKIRCSSECIGNKYSFIPFNRSESDFDIEEKNENELLLTGEIEIGQETQFICIRLRNEVGVSDQSDFIGVASDEIIPGPPNLRPIEDDKIHVHSVIIKWDPPQLKAAAAKQYIVQTNESDSNEWNTVKPENIEWYKRACEDPYQVKIKQLKPVTNYTFKVFAVNAKNVHGEPSNSACAKTAGGSPDAPDITSILPDDTDPSKGRLHVKKLDKMSENGSSVTGVIIMCYSCETSSWKLVKSSQEVQHDSEGDLEINFTIPNVTKSIYQKIQEYAFQVKVKNEFGKSPPSGTYYLQLSQLVRTGMVVGLTANLKDITSHSAKLTWKKPSINPGLVSRYIVRREIASESHNIQEGEVKHDAEKDNYNIKIENLESNHSYTFFVSAQALNGIESLPASVQVNTGELIPSAPTKLKADKVAQTEIRITWKLPINDPEAVHKYEIQVFKEKEEEAIQTTESKKTSKVIKELETYTTYKVRVIAMNENGKYEVRKVGKSKSAACAEIYVKTTLKDSARKAVNAFTFGQLARRPDKIDSDED